MLLAIKPIFFSVHFPLYILRMNWIAGGKLGLHSSEQNEPQSSLRHPVFFMHSAHAASSLAGYVYFPPGGVGGVVRTIHCIYVYKGEAKQLIFHVGQPMAGWER